MTNSPPDRTHIPTANQREMVQLHATVGTPQAIIADMLGIDDKTLRKHYREELDQSLAKANASPGPFLALLGKVLPLQVVGDSENPLRIHVTIGGDARNNP